MKKNDEDLESILNQIIDLSEDFGLSEIELQAGKRRFRIKRASVEMETTVVSPRVIKEELKIEDKYKKVTAPLGGIFYRASAANDPPYVEEGDVVEKGQTMALIEAMKVFNEIKADFAAKLIKILIENGKQIEAGTTLFLVEPIIPGVE